MWEQKWLMLLLDLVYKNFPYIIHILSSHPPDGYWWWGLNNLGLALEVTGWREQKCYDLRSLMTVWGSAPHPHQSPCTLTYLDSLLDVYINVQKFSTLLIHWIIGACLLLLLQQLAYPANMLTWRIIRFLEKSEEEMERRRTVNEVERGPQGK